jgi:hypothetical protein
MLVAGRRSPMMLEHKTRLASTVVVQGSAFVIAQGRRTLRGLNAGGTRKLWKACVQKGRRGKKDQGQGEKTKTRTMNDGRRKKG